MCSRLWDSTKLLQIRLELTVTGQWIFRHSPSWLLTSCFTRSLSLLQRSMLDYPLCPYPNHYTAVFYHNNSQHSSTNTTWYNRMCSIYYALIARSCYELCLWKLHRVASHARARVEHFKNVGRCFLYYPSTTLRLTINKKVCEDVWISVLCGCWVIDVAVNYKGTGYWA